MWRGGKGGGVRNVDSCSHSASVFLGGLEHTSCIFPFFPAPPSLPCASVSHLKNDDGKASSCPSFDLTIQAVSSPQPMFSVLRYSAEIQEADLSCELKG